MTERAHTPKGPEVHSMAESVEKALELLDQDQLDKAASDAKEHSSTEKLKGIQKNVENLAISGKEMNPSESHKDSTPSYAPVNDDLKATTYRRTMKANRRHLRPQERVFSKVIHQPIIEKVSEVAGATVARPSGIIGGGLLAVLGSSILLWITKKYGYEYNYLVYMILFVGGFALGIIIELALRFILRNKRTTA